VPVTEALRSVTSHAAYQFFEEDIKGSLEPGKLADMVVLEKNPLEIDKINIKDIPILATIVGGQIVYGGL
jgi:predicted amidohydrolase YtcJ